MKIIALSMKQLLWIINKNKNDPAFLIYIQ